MATLGDAPLPWLAIGARAFDQLPKFAHWARARKLANKRRRIDAWVAARPHLAWSAPGEGLFGLAVDMRTQKDLAPRIERGLRDHGVVVVPGKFFGLPNAFRLAWSIDEATLEEALTRLARVVDPL